MASGSANLERGSGGRAPSRVQGRAPDQGSGGEPPEAEALLVFGRWMKTANLSTFLKFGNAKKLDICAIFAKNHGWPRNWGGAWSRTGKKGCAFRPGPKTATGERSALVNFNAISNVNGSSHLKSKLGIKFNADSKLQMHWFHFFKLLYSV